MRALRDWLLNVKTEKSWLRRAALLLPLLVALLWTSKCGGGSTTSQMMSPLTITTISLPQGQASQFYSVTLHATGGITPYTWSVASGTLPPGLSPNASTGEISGTPTQSGAFGFTAQVRDSANQTASATLSISIVTAPLPGSGATIAVNTAVTHQTFFAWRFDLPQKHLFGTTPSCTLTPTAMRDGVVAAFADLGLNGERLGWGASSPTGIEGSANDNADPFNINMAGFQPNIEAAQPGACNDSVPDRIDFWTIPLRTSVLANGEPFDSYVSLNGDVRDFNAMYPWWIANINEATEGFEALFTWWHSRYGFYPGGLAFNEPGSGSCATSPVNTCYFSAPGHWMYNFNAAAANRLATNLGITARAESPNTVSAGDCLNAACNEIATNPGGLGRFAYHGYGAPTATQLNQVRTYAQTASTIAGRTIPVAMGEICCSPGSVTWNGTYAQGKDMLRFMHLHMTEADAAVYEDLDHLWVCASAGCPNGSATNGGLVLYDPGLTDYYLLPHYWVARQWMKYIRPNYVRVDGTSNNTNVYSMAWKRPNNTVVVNILNDTGSPQAITITGIPNGTYNLYQLDPTMCVSSGRNRCTPQTAQLAVGSGSVTLNLPADAAWTLSQQ